MSTHEWYFGTKPTREKAREKRFTELFKKPKHIDAIASFLKKYFNVIGRYYKLSDIISKSDSLMPYRSWDRAILDDMREFIENYGDWSIADVYRVEDAYALPRITKDDIVDSKYWIHQWNDSSGKPKSTTIIHRNLSPYIRITYDHYTNTATRHSRDGTTIGTAPYIDSVKYLPASKDAQPGAQTGGSPEH